MSPCPHGTRPSCDAKAYWAAVIVSTHANRSKATSEFPPGCSSTCAVVSLPSTSEKQTLWLRRPDYAVITDVPRCVAAAVQTA
jgi:hypothetical protein